MLFYTGNKTCQFTQELRAEEYLRLPPPPPRPGGVGAGQTSVPPHQQSSKEETAGDLAQEFLDSMSMFVTGPPPDEHPQAEIHGVLTSFVLPGPSILEFKSRTVAWLISHIVMADQAAKSLRIAVSKWAMVLSVHH
jgi:hypothetical protein